MAKYYPEGPPGNPLGSGKSLAKPAKQQRPAIRRGRDDTGFQQSPAAVVGSGVSRAEFDAFSEWIWRELNRISEAIGADGHLDLEKKFVQPARPQDGDIQYADGTMWNPGGGVGIYGYIAGAWRKLNN